MLILFLSMRTEHVGSRENTVFQITNLTICAMTSGYTWILAMFELRNNIR